MSANTSIYPYIEHILGKIFFSLKNCGDLTGATLKLESDWPKSAPGMYLVAVKSTSKLSFSMRRKKGSKFFVGGKGVPRNIKSLLKL